jgi:DNA mismatch endonuclease, patch repair protein
MLDWRPRSLEGQHWRAGLTMADVFTREKRSEIMSRVKDRDNAATEIFLVRTFRNHGIIGWRRRAPIFGKPDFIFRKRRLAIFVDGCFWHGCPVHGTLPRTNRDFWRQKLARNRKRDRLVDRTLKQLGWTPLRVWQHELRDPERVIRRVQKVLRPKD